MREREAPVLLPASREPPPRRPNVETTARAAASQACRATEVARPPLKLPNRFPGPAVDRCVRRAAGANPKGLLPPVKKASIRTWRPRRADNLESTLGRTPTPANKILQPCQLTTTSTLARRRSPPKPSLSTLFFGDLTIGDGFGPERPSPCREPREGGDAHRSSVHPNRSRPRRCHRRRLPTLR
jgi:hypothetical protein